MAAGRARRRFMSGIRLWPPAKTFPSIPAWRSASRALSRSAARIYVNGAGFMLDLLWPEDRAAEHLAVRELVEHLVDPFQGGDIGHDRLELAVPCQLDDVHQLG